MHDVGLSFQGMQLRELRTLSPGLLSSLRDSVPFLAAYPGLTPWAKLCRRSAAGFLQISSVPLSPEISSHALAACLWLIRENPWKSVANGFLFIAQGLGGGDREGDQDGDRGGDDGTNRAKRR